MVEHGGGRTSVALLTLAFVAFGLLLPFAVAIRDLPEAAVRDAPWRIHGGRLDAAHPFGELVEVPAAGLRRVDVALVDLGGAGTTGVELRVMDSGGERVLRRARATPTDLGPPGGWVRFDFEPLAPSDGTSIRLQLAPLGDDCRLSPWLRCRAAVGFERPWGDRVLDTETVRDTFTAQRRGLSGAAFAFEQLDAEAGEARLELRSEPDGTLVRTAVLPSEASVRGGYAVFSFGPVEDSRRREFSFRLELPEGARPVGTADGPSFVTLHSEGREPEHWCGATRGDRLLPDRDLVLRIHARSGAELVLDTWRERVGHRGWIAALLWIACAGWTARLLVRGARSRSILSAFLPLAVMHVAVFQLLLPPWMGEDEPWQLEYATLLAEGHWPSDGADVRVEELERHPYSHLQVRRRMPRVDLEEVDAIERGILASMARHEFPARVDWSERWLSFRSFDDIAAGYTGVQHPPLHGWLAGLAGGGASTPSLARLRRGRVLSAVCVVIAMAAGAWIASALLRDAAVAAAAAAGVCWLPTLARHGAVLNNDVLAIAGCSVTTALVARRVAGKGRAVEWLLAVVAWAVGVGAKSTAVGGVAVLAAGAWIALGGRPQLRAALGLGAVAAAIATVAAYSEHNTAIPDDFGSLLQRLSWTATVERLAWLWRTAGGAFNSYSRPFDDWFCVTYGATVGVLFAAGAAAVVRRRADVVRPALAVCSVAVLAQLALVALRGVHAFRYVLPAASALVPACYVGAVVLCPWSPRTAARALLCAGVLHAGWYVWAGLVPNQYWLLGS